MRAVVLVLPVVPEVDRTVETGVVRRRLRGGCSASFSLPFLSTTFLPSCLLGFGVALPLLLHRRARCCLALFPSLFVFFCCCFGTAFALTPFLPLLSLLLTEPEGALRFLVVARRCAGADVHEAFSASAVLSGNSAISIERHKKFSRVDETCLHLVQQISLAVAPRNNRSTWISTDAADCDADDDASAEVRSRLVDDE